jgi:2',3'-cyclic-nucleotide 2'-phosphodiesterase (5'-nucleotidase family)
MNWKYTTIFILLNLTICAMQAQVHLISAKRIVVDASYDSMANDSMQQVLAWYKTRLDQKVSGQIGECVQSLYAKAPESLLSNFLADQLFLKGCQLIPEGVDFSIINLGSIRAPLFKGVITVNDIYRMMPFENKLVILELKGSDVWSVFKSIARSGGGGVSNIRLEIDGFKLKTLLIGGKVPEKDKIYRVVTMDYLADGNSGMTALLNAVKRVDTDLIVRDVYIEQIGKLTAQGKKVVACLDGRIKRIDE